MNFDLGDEQKMLKESARKFFSKEADSSLVRQLEADEKGYSPELWGKMAQLGWMGLLVPEAYDGAGMNFLEMAVVVEAIGHAALPGPFFTSAVVSTLALLEGGSEDQKKQFLPELANGRKICTCGWSEEGTAVSAFSISTRAVRKGDHYVVTGTKLFVPYAHIADYLIIAARTGEATEDSNAGITLLIIDRRASGLSVGVIATSSGEKLCEIRLDAVGVPVENVLGEPNEGWKILQNVFQKSAVAKCVEMVGGAEKVLDMTVDYAKKREQFGHLIGSFQAIQHHCAKMKTYLDTSTLITYQTCWLISQNKPWEKDAAMCKAWVGESCRELMALGHQVMGGVGFMEESDHQLYYRRVTSAEIVYGDPDYHREVVARKMGL